MEKRNDPFSHGFMAEYIHPGIRVLFSGTAHLVGNEEAMVRTDCAEFSSYASGFHQLPGGSKIEEMEL